MSVLKKKTDPYFWIAILLLFPALLINLGLPTFIDDEAIRSLVALEMFLSGNYITPTLLGEYYYNKPPLFNWILLLSISAQGKITEFAARIPTIVALLGYGLTIFYFVKKRYGINLGFLSAFIFLTCGRILFWDSLLALIDISFSWVIFCLFLSVYYFSQREKILGVFLASYSLTAVGFMFKGLPSVVFQGITLFVYLLYLKKFKWFFKWQHFAGIGLFLVIVGGYYFVYDKYNSLIEVFPTLFSESSKRTVVTHGLWESILHFLTFPFEMVYHFLPWSLFILYFFNKKAVELIRNDKWMVFCSITFLSNILIYWTSPEVYPRYLLMLAPLIFIPFAFLHEFHEKEKTIVSRILKMLFLVAMSFISLAWIMPFFLERTQQIEWLPVKTLLLFTGSAILTLAFWKSNGFDLKYLIVFLIILRIGFNWFVLPDRNENDFGDFCRNSSKEIGAKFANEALFLYKETELQPTNAFYLTNERQKIITRKLGNLESNAVYIIDPEKYPGIHYYKLGEIKVRHGQRTFDVGKLKFEQ